MLCCLVFSSTDWEMILLQVEFAFNNSINRSTRLSPFHNTGYDAPTTVDLAPLQPTFLASASAVEFANHIKEIHTLVRQELEATYLSVKEEVDLHR